MADEKKSETAKKKSVYETLSAIDCRKESRKKNGLTYLPWAWAWARVMEHYPASTYRIYEDANGRFYHTDGRTAWVKTGVTIEGVELVEYLPVMDFRNVSIPLEKLTSFDVNKSIQRSLTKACARHGLGLYIFAGEDLPEGAEDATQCGGEAARGQGAKNGPQGASGATPSNPSSKTAPARQNASKGASAADPAREGMRAAWNLFLTTPAAKGMDANSRSNLFALEVKQITGRDNPRAVTAEEWAKVTAAIRRSVEAVGGDGEGVS